MAVVKRVSDRLLEQGAKATLLTGSHARGRAKETSDVDLFAVGDGPSQRVEVVDGRTVSVHWFTAEAARQRLTSPQSAFIAAKGWGDAIIVDDPIGVARELQEEARAWTWDKLAAEADAFAVDDLVELAEWARKLADALEARRDLDAAAFTADLALRLGRLVAIRRRVTSESENGLWPAIVEAAPPEWGRALRQALRAEDEDLRTAAAGALTLFEHLVGDVSDLLDEQQRPIVDHAVSVSKRWR
jgi:hypothetical protein